MFLKNLKIMIKVDTTLESLKAESAEKIVNYYVNNKDIENIDIIDFYSRFSGHGHRVITFTIVVNNDYNNPQNLSATITDLTLTDELFDDNKEMYESDDEILSGLLSRVIEQLN